MGGSQSKWLALGTTGLFALAIGCSSDSADTPEGTSTGGAASSGGAGGMSSGGTSGAGALGGAGGSGGAAVDTSPLGGDRPVNPKLPAGYDPSEPTPLVILLHGFGVSGVLQDIVFDLKRFKDEYGYILLAPDGTEGPGGRFWNATEACCDATNQNPDDVGYLQGLIEEASARFNIDPKRVFVTGHSNGGFMTHRFACDHASSVAAFASLAGAMVSNPDTCQPSEGVNSLEMHGTLDDAVEYNGDGGLQLGAEASQLVWAERNGCTGSALELSSETHDYDNNVDGSETEVFTMPGCPAGASVELWKMNDSAHLPNFTDDWRRGMIEWLLAHPKP